MTEHTTAEPDTAAAQPVVPPPAITEELLDRYEQLLLRAQAQHDRQIREAYALLRAGERLREDTATDVDLTIRTAALEAAAALSGQVMGAVAATVLEGDETPDEMGMFYGLLREVWLISAEAGEKYLRTGEVDLGELDPSGEVDRVPLVAGREYRIQWGGPAGAEMLDALEQACNVIANVDRGDWYAGQTADWRTAATAVRDIYHRMLDRAAGRRVEPVEAEVDARGLQQAATLRELITEIGVRGEAMSGHPGGFLIEEARGLLRAVSDELLDRRPSRRRGEQEGVDGRP